MWAALNTYNSCTTTMSTKIVFFFEEAAMRAAVILSRKQKQIFQVYTLDDFHQALIIAPKA